MNAITLNAIINDEHHLVVDLPTDLPKGPVKLTIEPVNASDATVDEHAEPTIEEIRAMLAAAGSLVTNFDYFDDIEDIGPVSEEELDALTRDIPPGRSVEDLVDEDRGTY